MELSPRKQKILSSIVNSYVASGEPVGSKLIADEIGVSSATVRNEMAELYELGLLEQPHTSAGRIPSPQGFRIYIDEFMEPSPLPKKLKAHFDACLMSGAYDREIILLKAAEALSTATKFTAAASTPSGRSAFVTAVQFVQISRRTAMLILMSSAGTMKTKVFHCEFDLSPEIMRIFFRVFNEKITGTAISDITPAFVQTVGISFGELTMLTSSALMALLETAVETMKADVILSGQMNLLFYPEFSPRVVRRINDLLENSGDALSILSCRSGRIEVKLGAETGWAEFENAAVISGRYHIGGYDAGGIGIVGPMRMNYPLITQSISYVTETVGKMLTALMKEEI